MREADAVLKAICERRSYRGEYLDAPVPREDLRRIMEAGLAAPSGCNRQTTSILAVDDPALLRDLKALVDPPIAMSAPAWVCVLTRRVIAYRNRCFSVQDYAAAIENMLLAIRALGYESCWYEGHITDEDQIGRALAWRLNVPDEYELVCVLPVGRAAGDGGRARKQAFEERAWFNAFGAGGS